MAQPTYTPPFQGASSPAAAAGAVAVPMLPVSFIRWTFSSNAAVNAELDRLADAVNDGNLTLPQLQALNDRIMDLVRGKRKKLFARVAVAGVAAAAAAAAYKLVKGR